MSYFVISIINKTNECSCCGVFESLRHLSNVPHTWPLFACTCTIFHGPFMNIEVQCSHLNTKGSTLCTHHIIRNRQLGDSYPRIRLYQWLFDCFISILNKQILKWMTLESNEHTQRTKNSRSVYIKVIALLSCSRYMYLRLAYLLNNNYGLWSFCSHFKRNHLTDVLKQLLITKSCRYHG